MVYQNYVSGSWKNKIDEYSTRHWFSEEVQCRIAVLVSPSRMLSFCGLGGTSYFKFLALHQGYGTMLQSYSETWLAMLLQYIFLTPR